MLRRHSVQLHMLQRANVARAGVSAHTLAGLLLLTCRLQHQRGRAQKHSQRAHGWRLQACSCCAALQQEAQGQARRMARQPAGLQETKGQG